MTSSSATFSWSVRSSRAVCSSTSRLRPAPQTEHIAGSDKERSDEGKHIQHSPPLF